MLLLIDKLAIVFLRDSGILWKGFTLGIKSRHKITVISLIDATSSGIQPSNLMPDSVTQLYTEYTYLLFSNSRSKHYRS